MAGLRILMMGTGPFAVPTFHALVDGSDPVVAVVTRPVPPQRRRRRGTENPMRMAAAERNVPVREPPDVNDVESREQLVALRPDLFVVCDYGQILTREALSVAPLGGINLHGSLLPKYRGAAPVNWAIYHGERETGVSVIHMTPRLDAGPCLVQRATAIETEETAPQLEKRLSELGVEPVQAAIEMLRHWDRKSPLGTIQDPAGASRAPRLKKEDGLIQWDRPADTLACQIRALKPWPLSYSYWLRDDGEPLRLIIDEASPVQLGEPLLPPGTVARADQEHLWVSTGLNGLALKQVQPAGKRVMPVADFLRGYRPREGQRFGDPPSPSIGEGGPR